MTRTAPGPVPTAFRGPNLPRLSMIKKSYDPYDVFSFPQFVPLP